MTRGQLSSVFYSNYNAGIDYIAIDEMIFLISKKYLVYYKEVLTSTEEYKKFVDKIDSGKINTFDIEGGGKGHLALKLMALKYFRGLKMVSVEDWFQGYRPDIIFEKDNELVIVECGDTNPNKILEYLKRKNVNKIIVITYPSFDEEKNVFQHIFTRDPKLNEYLDSKDELLYHNIRRIIQKR